MALNFAFTADNQNFINSVNQIRAGITDATKTIESCGGDIDKVISNIKKGIAAFGVATGFKEFASQVFNTRAQIQSLSISFETLLGNKDKANALFGELRKFAVQTPMMLKDLASGAQMMLGFGIEEDKIMPYLKALGDVSMGDAQRFQSLTLAFSQMSAAGKLMGQDLMQMVNAGFQPLEQISKDTGKSIKELKEEMSQGKISAEMVQQAFINATSEGGKFNGMLEKQSHGLAGAYSNLQGAVDDALNSIGESTEGLMATTLDAATSIAKNWEMVAYFLTTIAVSFGTEKAVLAGAMAVETSAYKAEIDALSALIPVKQSNINLDIQEALAKGKITEATAAKVIAIRKEVESNLENLATAKATATAEAQAAAQKYRAALQQSLAAKAAVEAKRQELIASGEICGAYISENAIKEMGIVTDKAKAASIASTTAKQEYHAAMTKKKIAVDALETAQTNADTVSKNLNARSTTFLTVAKEKLTLATKKLYGTMMAHPYALILAGVMALGYGIYKLCTYESDHSKSIREANEAAISQEKSMREEIKTLNDLKSNLDKTKKGTDEWKSAKDAIVSQFGKYFSGLDAEITKTGSLTSSYNELTKAIRMSAAARAMQEYRDKNDYSNDIDTTLENVRKSLTSRKLIKVDSKGNIAKGKNGGFEYVDGIGGELLESTMQKVYEYLENGDDSIFNAKEWGYLKQTGQFTKIDGAQSSVQKTRGKVISKKAGEAIIAQRYGTTVEDIDGVKENKDTIPETTYSEAKTKAEKEYKEAQALVAKMEKEGSKYTDKQYTKAIADLKAKKEAYEKLGGVTKDKKSSGSTPEQTESKQKEAHQKLLDLMHSQTEEKLKLDQDYEYQRWQNRIDLMEDGEAKVLEQMKLDNNKELTSLEQQKQDAVNAEIARQKAVWDAQQDEKAAGNKKYAKQVFNGDRKDKDNNLNEASIKEIESRYDALQADLTAKQKKAEQDRIEASKESMNAYLKEFGNYQEKRIAIEEEYNKQIDKAENDGQRMMLTAQKNKALSDLDYSEWVDTGAIAMAFGDISKLSDKTINQLISDMEKYRGKVISTFDPDKIQKYEEALTGLRKVQSDNSFGIFSSIVPDYFKERKSTANQMDSAGEDINALYEKRAEIYNRIIDLQQKIKDGEANGEDVSGLNTELKELEVELDANGSACKKAQNVFKQLQQEWDKLETPQEKFNGLTDSIASIGNEVLNVANAAVEMISAFDVEVPKEVTKLIDGLSNALGGLESMDLTRPFTLITGFFKTITGIGQTIGSLLGLFKSDSKHEKNIENLQKKIDKLQKSYDKLGKAIDKSFSTDASDLIDQQNTLIEQQKDLIRLQIAEEEAKKNSDQDKINKWKEQLDALDDTIEENKEKAKEAIIGEDIKSAINEFASAYADAWASGADAADASTKAVRNMINSALTELLKKNLSPAAQKFYDRLAEMMKKGYLTDSDLAELDIYKREMDAIAERQEAQFKKIQERYKTLEEIREELTDISFDSVSDNFKSLLSDMNSSTKDFTNSFTEMLRNAIVQSLMNEKYEALLKEWYAEFADAMKGGMTDEEREYLRQKYQSIVDQGLADRDAIKDLIGGDGYSQEASKGGWATMGQDTADELNGRFTALTELEAINNNLVSEGNAIGMGILATLQSMVAISGTTSDQNPELLDIRDMMFLTTGYLEDIAKYSKQLISIAGGIDKLNNLINDRL